MSDIVRAMTDAAHTDATGTVELHTHVPETADCEIRPPEEF